METFTCARPFSPHPSYFPDREKAHRELELKIQQDSIDRPLIPMIQECIPVPHCYTVQCCFGHFVHEREPDAKNLVPLSYYTGLVEHVNYRLAYLTVCLQDSTGGRQMYADLEALAALDPDYIQFGSADWFWERTVNTYCIQLEPERFKTKDSGMISLEESLVIEELRKDFFDRLAGIIHNHRVYPHSSGGV